MQLVDLIQFRINVVLDAATQLQGTATQVVCGHLSQQFPRLFHQVYHRLNLFDVVGRFIPDKGLEKLCKHDAKVQREPPGGGQKSLPKKPCQKNTSPSPFHGIFQRAQDHFNH